MVIQLERLNGRFTSGIAWEGEKNIRFTLDRENLILEDNIQDECTETVAKLIEVLVQKEKRIKFNGYIFYRTSNVRKILDSERKS